LILAPGLLSWLIVICVYLHDNKPPYVPLRLRKNRYFGRLRAIFANIAYKLLKRIGTFFEDLRTHRKRTNRQSQRWFPATQSGYTTRRARQSRHHVRLLLCLSATKRKPSTSVRSTPVRYDSDSFLIAIDNCCSKCMTNNKQDFVGPMTRANVKIKGINGISQTCFRGTVKWSFEDSQGRRYDHIIPGAYYCPDLPCRLLSPQHWAQTRNDNFPKKGGTICETYDDRVVLRWSQRRFELTVPLDASSNVAYIRTVAGFE